LPKAQTAKKRELLPIHDRIIVRRKPNEEKILGGGFILPADVQEKHQEGTVIAVGEGRHEAGRLEPLSVQTGDVILFGKYAGLEMEVDGEQLMIMREEEVLAILRESNAARR
jgi:chaperonin GroES